MALEDTFFWKLGYVVDSYNGTLLHYNADDSLVVYSEQSKEILQRLITYVQDCKFSDSEVTKFICKHWELSGKALSKKYEEETGRTKSENTFRSQRSYIGKYLNLLFGEDFLNDFIEDDASRINNILDCIDRADILYVDAFIKEIKDYKENIIHDYEISDLEDEIKALNIYSTAQVKKVLTGLDLKKMYYIKRVMNQPLLSDKGINEKKLELLLELDV